MDTVTTAYMHQAMKREYSKIETPLSAAEMETFNG
jgi:hypothetical protein